ncbi:hypothetical protein A3E39_00660 [Candidatus Uhrbacteria bacterium RIFCSPHIGHO2_12_FULL_60_25]|uniref:NAD-dependent epimerase/dehydratase domain-containing protein n=1 Tax=Candidatus Uhrbacteria bacterium RIFCSPHIGHO2_12_FULL_60_25 TaxID=1802399 RepID=A0A1F7UMV1_9BACT|nr:MAG: hypothetical protein A3D73_03270 [Candidatus Uhrbacteria bacterium RIFCSPHIGHO2_02_FULL_60_44]OGL79621.1 MAG: hypothetical protein A3E39_00660 [Candidatus Uhrbacteria bacterium RIFCSPHIGHO2_12_FULL_60_25]
MKQHILVTGGAGFIGSHLVDALLQAGHEVTVIDILSDRNRGNLNPKARNVNADLTKLETIGIVEALAPDVIFHFAGNASVPKSVADPVMDMEINYVATARLLDVASKIGVKRFVFSSTGGGLSSEYTTLPTPENTPSRPLSPYVKHKLASEELGEFYCIHRGLPFVALRFANVYGPRQTVTCGEANVIATFAHKMVRNEPVQVNGNGLQTRDYVYVDDVIDACLMLLDQTNAAGPLNVGSEHEINVSTLHRVMAQYLGYRVPVIKGPADTGASSRSCLDITKIRMTLGWKPTTSIQDGLKRTLDWHREEVERERAKAGLVREFAA